jgi:hypothetical protein
MDLAARIGGQRGQDLAREDSADLNAGRSVIQTSHVPPAAVLE